jgi:hypothetical protein
VAEQYQRPNDLGQRRGPGVTRPGHLNVSTKQRSARVSCAMCSWKALPGSTPMKVWNGYPGSIGWSASAGGVVDYNARPPGAASWVMCCRITMRQRYSSSAKQSGPNLHLTCRASKEGSPSSKSRSGFQTLRLSKFDTGPRPHSRSACPPSQKCEMLLGIRGWGASIAKATEEAARHQARDRRQA